MAGLTNTERQTIAQLFELEQESKQRKYQNLSQISDLLVRPKPSTVGQKFEQAIDIGAAQLRGDIQRYSLAANVLLGRDNKAALNKTQAEVYDREAAIISEGFDSFEDFIKEPTFSGFANQVVYQVGKFVPNALTSAASAIGGAGVGGLAKWGLTQSSKRYARRLITNGARREMGLGATDVPTREMVKEAYRLGRNRAMKSGAVIGAFSQEQLIGTAQSVSEYQEAGMDITKDEALMANLLGIPQAIVGTFGEIYFAKTLFKSALRDTGLASARRKAREGIALSSAEKAVVKAWTKIEKGLPTTKAERELVEAALGGKGGVVATFLKDVASGLLRSGVVEGTTETIQEGLTIMQRFAIDPDYTAEQARLRLAEAAFGGFFAGGARGGVGAVGTSILRQAREMVDNKEQAFIDIQGRSITENPIPENKEQIDAKAAAMEEDDNNTNALVVTRSSTEQLELERKARGEEARVSDDYVTVEDARTMWERQQELSNEAKQQRDQQIAGDKYEIEERVAIMMEGGMSEAEARASVKEKQPPSEDAVNESLYRQDAIAMSAKVFATAPGASRTTRINTNDFFALVDVNTKIIGLEEQAKTKPLTKEQQIELRAYKKERDDLIKQIKSVFSYAVQRGLSKLWQFPEWGDRIQPAFTKEYLDRMAKAGTPLLVRHTEAASLYTTDKDKADLFMEGADAGSLAVILNFNKVANPEHDLVLEVLNEKGAIIKQETTKESELQDAINKAREDYPSLQPRATDPDAKYTWQTRALDVVVRERAMDANLNEMMDDFAAREEEGETLSSEGAFLRDEGLEAYEAPIEKLLYGKNGQPWKAAPAGLINKIGPKAADELNNLRSKFLEKLNDAVEENFWEGRIEQLNSAIIKEFLRLKKENPNIGYAIVEEGLDSEGNVLQAILQQGEEVSMKQVLWQAARSSEQQYRNWENTKRQKNQRFRPSPWTIVRTMGEESTQQNPIWLNTILTASVWGRHTLKDPKTGEFRVWEAGLPPAWGGAPDITLGIPSETEGTWLQKVGQAVATMMVGFSEGNIELYYEGELVTDLRKIANKPIYRYEGKWYSINSLLEQKKTVPDTSIGKQLDTLKFLILNTDPTNAKPGGGIPISPSKWAGNLTEAQKLQLYAALQAMLIKKHTVAKNQTIEQIAKIYGITVGEIEANNPGLVAGNIAGQTLSIPPTEKTEEAILVDEIMKRTYDYLKKSTMALGVGDPFLDYLNMDNVINTPLPDGAKMSPIKIFDGRELVDYYPTSFADFLSVYDKKLAEDARGSENRDPYIPPSWVIKKEVYTRAKQYFTAVPEAADILNSTPNLFFTYGDENTFLTPGFSIYLTNTLLRVRDEGVWLGHITDIAYEMGYVTQEERDGIIERQEFINKDGGELADMMNQVDDVYGLPEGEFDQYLLTRMNIEEAVGGVAVSKETISKPDRRDKRQVIGPGLSWTDGAAAFFDGVKQEEKTYKGVTYRPGRKSLLDEVRVLLERDLKLDSSVKVILAEDDVNFVISRKEFNEGVYRDEAGIEIRDPNVYIKNVIKQMKNPNNPDLGRVIEFGNTSIVILNPKSFQGKLKEYDIKLLGLLALTHELGHPIFTQEFDSLLDDKKKQNIRDRLWKDFTKAQVRLNEQGSNKYQGELGFEEWFADQVSKWVMKNLNNQPATNGVESYFKRFVNKIRKFWTNLNKIIRARFGEEAYSESFEKWMNDVAERNRKNMERSDRLYVTDKIKVRKFMEDVIVPKVDSFIGAENRKKMDSTIKQIANWVESSKVHLLGKERQHWSMAYLLKPADNFLRALGPAGAAVADVFYNPSQSEKTQRGHLNARIWFANRKLNRVWDIMEPARPGEPTKAEIEAFREILFEAEAEVPTASLSEKAQQVRQFLKEFSNTLKQLGIKEREIFYPRQFDIAALVANLNGERQALVQLLEYYNPGPKDPGFSFTQIVEALVRNEEGSDDNNIDGVPDRAADISIGMAEERAQYFRRIPNEALRWGVNFKTKTINPRGETQLGILLQPEEALRKYVTDMTKRDDYNKRAVAVLTQEDVNRLGELQPFGDVGTVVRGWKAMEVLLGRIDDPVKRQAARNAVKAMLGKVGMGMSRLQRNLNSGLLTLNITTYLTMATVASFPDLAGPILRSKGALPMKDFVNVWKSYFADKEAARAFARDVGVITFDSLDTMYINAAELGFMTPLSKKVSTFYFKTIGLEAYTKFTRVFAAGMGEQFLLRLAEQNTEEGKRWMKELFVSREDILHWNKNNRSFEDEQGKRVQNAIAQFVDESIVRPNAAERPVWASNPYFALVWQLKSFFYAYGKNIIGGVMRESQNKYNRTGQFSQAAIPLLIGAVPMLLLSMLGLELREFVKYLYANVDPGFEGNPADKFRTNDMGWFEYFFEIVDRAGILGAFTLLFPMLTAGNYGDEFWVSPLGPTAQRIEDLIKGDLDIGDNYLPWVSAIN